MMWRRVFPGETAQVGEVRKFVAALLSGHPVHNEALSCVSELASNAVLHSNSQEGTFTVQVWQSKTSVRLAVADAGGPSTPAPQPPRQPELDETEMAEGGRGLAIVAALSSRMGVEGGPSGRLVWADLHWPEDMSASDFAHMADTESNGCTTAEIPTTTGPRPIGVGIR